MMIGNQNSGAWFEIPKTNSEATNSRVRHGGAPKGDAMKRLVIISLVALAMIVTGSVATAQTGKVVYYSAGGAKVAKAVVKAFGKKYPDIAVEHIVGGTGELSNRIKAEKDNPRGDVFRAAVEAS